MKDVLRIHSFLPSSRANGPGCRAVLWTQGCTLACPGCFNPETHTTRTGQELQVEELFEQIQTLTGSIEGITISGGEPLQQRAALQALLQRVRQSTELSVLVFTGYTWEELQRMKDIESLLGSIDILIAGRYDQARRQAQHLIGSANKTVHFLTDRYTPADLQDLPEAELIITETGEVMLTGIDPMKW